MEVVRKNQDKETTLKVGDILVIKDKGVVNTFLVCFIKDKIRVMSFDGYFSVGWEYDSEQELADDLKNVINDVKVYSQDEYRLELARK